MPAILASSLLILFFAGCQTARSHNKEDSGATREHPIDARPAPAPKSDAEAPRLSQTRPDEQEINALLEDAEMSMATEQFVYPAGNSALAFYDRVLILDPQNETALRGLESIVEHYLAEAMDAAANRRFEQARAFLEQARLVDPEHPGVVPTMEQITMLASANRMAVNLDADLLKARDPLLIESLRSAGKQSREPGCRAVIYARSDAEGRWIYQQMSTEAEGEGGERVRANLQISWPARIEVLCFQDQASE